ncbi:MAG: hypothetical protein RBU24_16855, partial [Kiritimatiellia bacterium]|nr:hypothetical protein [Kiritimatiellia bacterium]
LFEVVQRLDPAADNSVDSDGDGWADWKERLAGTDADDMSSVPVTPDDAQTAVPMLFEATVTLGGGPAVPGRPEGGPAHARPAECGVMDADAEGGRGP